MLIDRHRVAALIQLSQVATRSEAERAVHRDNLEVLLISLYNGATPAAREAFLKRMNPISQELKPWAAVMRPDPAKWIGLGPPVPPVLTLLLGQLDDEPDAAEDGNRLPDRDSHAGAPWRPLYAALDRWDTAAILRHIGPVGWQAPEERPVPLEEGYFAELVPLQAVPVFASARPPRVMHSNGAAPTAPAPSTGGAVVASVPPIWQRPAVLVAGGVLLGLSFSAIGIVIASRKTTRELPGVTP